MLLRSSSSPILKTCIHPSSATVDSAQKIPSKRNSLTPSASPIKTIQRTSSESNMRQIAIPKRHNLHTSNLMGRRHPTSVEEEEETFVSGGGNGGGLAGRQGFGGDWGGGRGKKQSMDEYYQNMIEIYPGDPLLLANYAKFLKETRGDLVKAEEYCERAILVKPDDGEVLSMYGDLIWNNHRDGDRAKYYFDRALQASPEDCNVLASHARYLWLDGNEDEEEEMGKKDDQQKHETQTFTHTRHVRFSQGRPPLAAASN
ncbi:Tetratricopeptide TPR-1 [Corchorus capsularis]|uniref:Tetratricopeptide TPR-1 n=1 Tax=Corchorus capsularis TaxID=210143 RepID=A0A1R3GU92_COCAP|nr:Tetratricopeptide TPR-1 [Corchorus capsularis]